MGSAAFLFLKIAAEPRRELIPEAIDTQEKEVTDEYERSRPDSSR